MQCSAVQASAGIDHRWERKAWTRFPGSCLFVHAASLTLTLTLTLTPYTYTLHLPYLPAQPSPACLCHAANLPICIFCLLPYFQKFQARSSTLFGPALSLLAVSYCAQVCLYLFIQHHALRSCSATSIALPCSAISSAAAHP